MCRRVFIHAFIFSVKRSIRNTAKGEMVDTFALECEDLEPSANWTLAGEDPLVYLNEDREGYNPARQWPQQPFPTVPEPATPTDPVPEASPTIDLKQPLAMHHLLTDWCLSLGEDPCRLYQLQKVSHLLEAVQAKTTECPVCHDKLSNTQRLRAHIRAKHMEVTPHHCEPCNRYFGDAATLNLHKRKHDKDAVTYACPTCNKVYTVKSRLTEHLKSHLPENLNQPCRYCGTVIKEKKNLKSHEANCKSNTQKKPRIKCPYCTRDYQQKKDLKVHVKNHHESRLATWEKDLV